MTRVQFPAVPILPSILQLSLERRLETFHDLQKHKNLSAPFAGQ